MRERDAPGGGLEVFCVRRHARSAFLGGALVFPGGKVDAADGHDEWADLAGAPHPRSAAMAGESATARTLAIAACRELLEEAGIAPLCGARSDDASSIDMEVLRREIAAGFAAALRVRGLRLSLDRLVPFARWITPEAESRRFDTRFYLLALPPGQQGAHDAHEVTTSFWGTPSDVLAAFERGEWQLAPPTTRTLELLSQARDVRGAMDLALTQSLAAICPRFVAGAADDGPCLALPGDPEHDVRERRVAGPTRFVLREGRFVSAEAPSGQQASSGSRGLGTSET